RDELDQRAAVTEIEYAEKPGDRGREGPEAVGSFAEVRHVEWQHHQADEAIDEDRDVARADVPRDELDRTIGRAPYRRVQRTVHRVVRRRFGDAVSGHATTRAVRRENPFARAAASFAPPTMARPAFSRTRACSRTATMSASR